MSSLNLNIVSEMFPNKKDLVIFDIGAHNFSDSVNMKARFPEASVYAFEPDNLNINKYAQSALNNGVNIAQVAMSDENGEATFYNSETLNGAEWSCSGSILKPVTKNGTKEGLHEGLLYNLEGYNVKTVTLETFCDNHQITPDLLHMDVQGAETKVMNGIGNYRPKIIFAETCEFKIYETNTTLEEFDALMKSLGYVIYQRLTFDTLYIYNQK